MWVLVDILRLISALVDEGRKILDEGIAQRSGDIDVVYVIWLWLPGVARWSDALRR